MKTERILAGLYCFVVLPLLVLGITVFAAQPPQKVPGLDLPALAASRNYNCDTRDGAIVVWRDARPQPTADEWRQIALEMMAEKNREVSDREKLDALWESIANGDNTKLDQLKLRQSK